MDGRAVLWGAANDGRIWLLTTILLGWYALESVVGATTLPGLFEPINALMFAYYVSLGQLFVLAGPAGFWLGFAAFCWVIAASLVLSGDRIRAGLGRSRPD